jgi:energy-coupling factor transporter transmembrane protein EcfT
MDQLENLLNRPKAYYNIDGVGELAGGFMCLGYALLMWLQAHAPKDSVWHGMPAFTIYVGLMCLILHYGPKAIKKHITYPRTGFVEYRKRDTRWRPMILGAVVAAAVTVGLGIALRRHWNLATPASLFGLLFAASYAYHFARTVRWKWAVAGVVALGSVAIAMLPPDLVSALANHSWQGAFILAMTLFGAVLLVSGGISFWLYLRHTEPPEQEAQ